MRLHPLNIPRPLFCGSSPYVFHDLPHLTPSLHGFHDPPTPTWYTPPHPCMTQPNIPIYITPHPCMTHPPLHDPPLHDPSPIWPTPPLQDPLHPTPNNTIKTHITTIGIILHLAQVGVTSIISPTQSHPTKPHTTTPAWPTPPPPNPCMTHPIPAWPTPPHLSQITLCKDSYHNNWHHSASGSGRSNIYYLTHPTPPHQTSHHSPLHDPPHPCMTHLTLPLE